jgi:hypothetical protein
VALLHRILKVLSLNLDKALMTKVYSSFHQPLHTNIGIVPRIMGPGVTQRLRRYATSRTDPGSIPGGVTGFFRDIFPSDRTMVLGSTQALVKMSTRNIPGGKGGRCVRLTTSPPSCAECHGIWEPKTFWNALGHAGPVTGNLYLLS